MTIAKRQHVAAAFVIAGSMLHCGIAYGQDQEYEDLTIEEALQFCAAFKNDAERLGCFEALAESARGSKTDIPLAESPTSDAEVAESPTNETGAIPEALAETRNDDVDDTKDTASKTRFTFVRSDEAEQKRKKRERFELTVYRAWRNAVGELRLAFTNGEIWAQAGNGARYTPQPGEKVVFKPGLLGGWTLSMDGGRFGIRARHINKSD